MQLVKKIFIRIPWGAMGCKPTATKGRGVWQAAQILFPRWGELLSGPMHGFLSVLTEIVVEAEITGRLIVIPRNDDVAHILHQLQTFIGVGVIPNNISQANYSVSMRLHIRQHRFKCLRIGV